ncbi:site-specific DNA-methyltransferase [Sabulilitoribacter multivorans]|uniref:Site-specific DNA-methyltransferase n=1 Tax=Flaviramulus multivorans TaxID=1304750 RepID=A0ABS9IHA5_9FLAO|nr:DNA methyltransferase [Flaviramulus multivorans]MCF7559540.1 site-specific DNA-methyltransferase [Flaviramulus multivorans]
MAELLNIKEASNWATEYLKKEVSPSNISYLIQYGRVKKIGENGNTQVAVEDLKSYYEKNNQTKEERWKDKLGEDLNWTLSFSEYKESQTTKHVHRLHPYKGKFIPQLVEYFLDDHTDKFKKDVFFKKGNIVLDPFCGSGTTLVQSNELGINAIGVDISAFNTEISNSKVGIYNVKLVSETADAVSKKLKSFLNKRNNIEFENKLLEKLKEFNNNYFPSPEYKYKVRKKEINEKEYGKEKEDDFLKTYNALIEEYSIGLSQDKSESFLDKWFVKVVREEIDFVFNEINQIKDESTKKILSIILSRTIRSCRATTHSDLATLFEPQIQTYYCKKHGKICKPLFSIYSWFNRYSKDTIKRLNQFNSLRTDTSQICLTGDSRNIDIVGELKKVDSNLAKIVKTKKVDGIFSSPPYVGLIDYHEQHAYSYDLFGFERKDNLEIGPLYKGQGKEARESYTKGIADVLNNSKIFLKDNYDIFLVSNDKYNLYPKIAELAGMKIVNQYKRPVLNRVEKDRNAYSEIIFHLKSV